MEYNILDVQVYIYCVNFPINVSNIYIKVITRDPSLGRGDKKIQLQEIILIETL